MTAHDRPFYASDDGRRCPDNVTDDAGAPTRSRCPRAPADGYNPLGRCVDHLVRYRGRIRDATPIGDDGAAVVLDFGERSQWPVVGM